MDEHPVLHAWKDHLAAIDPIVDRYPVLPFAALSMSGDACVL
jgi:hypothetical protein